jgi:DNA-binding IclR family transcriptional regulator
VGRALDLLVAMEKALRPMGLSELARAAGIPKATALRLLWEMESRGFVQKELGQYHLGVGVITLSRAFLLGDRLRMAAQPMLQHLAQATGDSACLYVRHGFDRVLSLRAQGPAALQYTDQIGMRVPLHLGAAGHVLAAALPECEKGQWLERLGTAMRTEGRELDADSLLAKLSAAKQLGFCASFDERGAGFGAVAAPVTCAGKGVIAAVAVNGPLSRITPERVPDLSITLRNATHETAAAYGDLSPQDQTSAGLR